MSLVRRIAIALVASVGLLLASVVTASAATGGVPFTVELTGEAEVSPTTTGALNAGDLDGSGTAHLTVNPGTGVCWTIEVTGVEPITEAHIHKAPSTTNGRSLYLSRRTIRWLHKGQPGAGARYRSASQLVLRQRPQRRIPASSGRPAGGSSTAELAL
jgi:CHRD domain